MTKQNIDRDEIDISYTDKRWLFKFLLLLHFNVIIKEL